MKKIYMDMTCLPDQERNLDKPNVKAVSLWKNPIPFKEHAKRPVVVYFHSDKWIPISCFSLDEAILLYRKALFLGKEILVYPPVLELSAQGLSEELPDLS